ncbi:MAG TPA: hypothetical protein PKG95_01875 [Anaerolineaceae bacterium]|nr:hypothetical protein [Anaerolineaceae bacterium]
MLQGEAFNAVIALPVPVMIGLVNMAFGLQLKNIGPTRKAGYLASENRWRIWSGGRVGGWPIGRLVDWSIGRLVDWLVGRANPGKK